MGRQGVGAPLYLVRSVDMDVEYNLSHIRNLQNNFEHNKPRPDRSSPVSWLVPASSYP